MFDNIAALPEPAIKKKIGKIRLRSNLSSGLIYDLSFRIQLHLIFHRIEFKNRFNILFGGFSLAHSGVWCWTRLNIESYSLLKPTKVGFIFIGPNTISRAEDFSAVNHVTQAVVKLGRRLSLKSGSRNYDSNRSF